MKKSFTAILFIVAFWVIGVNFFTWFKFWQVQNYGKIQHKYTFQSMEIELNSFEKRCSTPRKNDYFKLKVSKVQDEQLKQIDPSLTKSFSGLVGFRDEEKFKKTLLELQTITGIKATSSQHRYGLVAVNQSSIRPINPVDNIQQIDFERILFTAYATAIAYNLTDSLTNIAIGIGDDSSIANLETTNQYLTLSSFKTLKINLSQNLFDTQTNMIHEIVGHYDGAEYPQTFRLCDLLEYLEERGFDEKQKKHFLFDLISYNQEKILKMNKSISEKELATEGSFARLDSLELRPYAFENLYEHLNENKIQNFGLESLGNSMEFEAVLSESLGDNYSNDKAKLQALRILSQKTNNRRYLLPEYLELHSIFINETNWEQKLAIAKQMEAFLKTIP
ncbi:MAG: hypothetical protein ACRCXZ_10055 [Patescibacteria group bacterium]